LQDAEMKPDQAREIVVVEDLPALIEAAAQRIAACVTKNAGRGAICLTGGATPEPVYRRLAAEPYRSAIAWDRVHFFWGDDRFVPSDDARSNAGMARRALLDRVAVPPGNIHPIPTNAATPQQAARLYEDEMKRFYGADRLDPSRPLFDIVLLGLGADGHTASLFPGAAALEERSAWAAGIDRAGFEPFVPRVTLTFATLASTRDMLFLISGAGKREVLTRIFCGEQLPAARARSNGSLAWLMDRAAAPPEAKSR